jgi:hypothetical protein
MRASIIYLTTVLHQTTIKAIRSGVDAVTPSTRSKTSVCPLEAVCSKSQLEGFSLMEVVILPLSHLSGPMRLIRELGSKMDVTRMIPSLYSELERIEREILSLERSESGMGRAAAQSAIESKWAGARVHGNGIAFEKNRQGAGGGRMHSLQ